MQESPKLKDPLKDEENNEENNEENKKKNKKKNNEEFFIKTDPKIYLNLMEKKHEKIKYLRLKCKKEVLKKLLKKSENLEIYKNNKSEPYEIVFKGKERHIIEIKSDEDKIYTFVELFTDDTFEVDEEFTDLESYKDQIDKLNKEEDKIIHKKKNCLTNTLVVVFVIISILAFLVFFFRKEIWKFVGKYFNSNKQDIEEKDDPVLNYIIKITNKKYKNEEKITIKYNNNNIKYIGPLKNYDAEGNGKFFDKNYNETIKYEGNFQKGFLNGNGIMHYYKGKEKTGYYNGSWINSNRSGQGEMHFEDGSIYNGLWKNDKRNGNGTLNYSNGDYYKGEFMDDKRHGNGTLTYSNGDYYKGEFMDDQRHGNGTLNYSNGDYYKGEFKNDKRHGKGKLYYNNGDYYIGDFMNNLKEGNGTYYNKSGKNYSGFWIKDKVEIYYKDKNSIIIEKEDDPELKAYTYIYIRDMSNSIKDGKKSTICYKNHYLKYTGYFNDYKANGEGIYYSKDMNNTIIYEGHFEKGFPNGNGTIHYYKGNKETGYYTGSWYYGKKSGEGKMHYSNGDYYIGSFQNNHRNGQGKVYNSNNEIRCEGSFINGIYQKSKWETIKAFFGLSKPHCY